MRYTFISLVILSVFLFAGSQETDPEILSWINEWSGDGFFDSVGGPEEQCFGEEEGCLQSEEGEVALNSPPPCIEIEYTCFEEYNNCCIEQYYSPGECWGQSNCPPELINQMIGYDFF